MGNDNTDIIIPVYNETALTRDCLESIAENSDSPYHLILIDNASLDETKSFLEGFAGANKNVTLVRNDTNIGWVKAVNQGIKASSGPYVCIMNNDTIVRTSGWLSKLMAVIESADDIGLVNPRFDLKKNIAGSKPYVEIDFCRGYCILIKRSVIDKVGGLDEAYGLGYYDDDDLSMRAIQAGFRCVRVNHVFVEHLKDSTFSAIFADSVRRDLHEKNKQLFYSKWGRRLKILCIITKAESLSRLKELLLSLARRQHIVYLWNLGAPLKIEHSNIRESRFPNILSSAVFALLVRINMNKDPEKRYRLVFADDERIAARLSKISKQVSYVDINKDAEKILRMADNAARA